MNLMVKNYYLLLSEALKSYGLDKDFQIVMYLDEQGHDCSQAEIGRALGIDKVSFVRIINGLEKKGYIIRLPNAKDRREKRVGLTNQSKMILPWVYAEINHMNRKIFKGISVVETNTLKGYLDQMIANMSVIANEKTGNMIRIES